jgi:ribosomal protein S25
VTDFLDEKRQEITSRLKELRPLVDEFNRLEAAAAALAGVIGSAASDAGSVASAAAATVTRRRGPGRPRGSASRKKAAKAAAPAATATAPKAAAPKAAAKPAKRRAGRRKGSGTRAAEARSFVQGQPGITIPELAAKMGIKQNYLYRVLPGLEQENKVEKKGRGWYPKG